MRICIVGAGAIGGLVGAKLALAGEEVTFIVRGANLEAIRRDGVKLLLADGTQQSATGARATDDTAEAGPQDLVILAVKAHQLPDIAPRLGPLYGPGTCVVTMQNGVPFWYFHRHGGALEGATVRSVDPQGDLARWIPPERVLGCVVYPASELTAPGVVRHIEGDRFPLGELDGGTTERVARIAETFTRAGFKAPVLEDIRSEIWLKLWGNLTFNPISSLAHSTLVDICRFPLSRELAANMMREAADVAGRLGVSFRVSVDKRIAGAEKVGRHKTSMLQDIEAGRPPETEALVGAVIELGRLLQVPTPHISTVYALMRLLAHTMEQERAQVRMHALAA
ncbi:MAG TPA: 2-dehydropantoate 2-reductase [Ramlibacter sp.]|nr:2-dehydropantoate 2-reductase [Ramlibacter sp.]